MNDDPEKPTSNLSEKKHILFELQRKANLSGKRQIPLREDRQSAPLSFAQQRLWFLDQLEPNSPVYNLKKTVKLTGTIQVDALQKALDGIVRRHETLRTTFSSTDGIPLQIIGEPGHVDLTVIDLTSSSEDDREIRLTNVLRNEAQRPFNLSKDPLLRATLVHLNDQEHVLLLVIHHIASDDWSNGILLHELGTSYRSFITGIPLSLVSLPIQYADFAVWQRQWLQGETLDAQLSYWKKKLAGAPPSIELPTDRPRPPIQTSHGRTQRGILPTHLYEAIKILGQRESTTLFMTLLAAFNVLLFRYTHQKDILIGTPIAGRTRIETEPLIGFFVNTLVLRTDLSGNPTFRELLQRVREVALDAYAHQDLPFEKLVEELQPERSLSQSALFQVMFALQNAPRPPWELPGLTIAQLEVESNTARFDLTLTVIEKAKELHMRFGYNTDLFDDTTITRMQNHFQTLLEGIVADPDQRVSELPILTQAERNQLLIEWNETTAEYPHDRCVHQLFEAQVKLSPDEVAIIFRGEKLTFRELNRRSNQLAHHLRSLGVGPEVLVGICMDRSIDMMVGLLGILKAGGAYVPLDPAFPRERLMSMLEDSQPAVVLTHANLANSLGSVRARILHVDSDWEEIAKHRDDNPHSTMTQDNLAYVIYTSGSTGRPKGVEILHRSVVNFLTSIGEQPGLTPQDVLLAVTSLSFDIAVLELFLPIVQGARVIIASREEASSGEELLILLQQYQVTAMQATPATWRLLLAAGWQDGSQMKILCGGEKLRQELAEKLLASNNTLWNLYGPTETTIWSTFHQVKSTHRPISIGRPIANTKIYILDRDMNPVPIGVPGDLYIGGVGLARGYRNSPQLTADRFISNPFGEKAESRIYKTGDLARYQMDGNIQYLARTDHQVKIRGFRVELGEIESVLGQHQAISENVIIEREDTPGDNRLVAYLVCRKRASPSISELRNFLLKKLPEYMVPSSFTFLDALPLTPNGKVDRAALPAPEGVRPDLDKEFVVPRTSSEEVVAGIWKEILKLDEVSIHDNFFELGGHSLMATRVISRIRDSFNVELSLRSFFEEPTIAELVQMIAEGSGEA